MNSIPKNIHELAKQIKQMQDAARTFHAQITPKLVEIAEKSQESIRPIIEAQENLKETLKPIIEKKKYMDEVVEKLANTIEPILAFRRNIKNIVSPAFENFVKSFEILPGRTRNVLLLLGQHGWFLDLEIPLPGLWELERAFETGDINKAEQALIEYYKKKLPGIAEDLNRDYPYRTPILNAAFNAHKRGEYELSVPVFLAQADGICQELIGFQLFTKKNKKPVTAVYVEKIVIDTFRSAFLYPLACTLPISESKGDRGTDFDQLNRHQVIHGESVNYGTEVNSLKAISLLNYVAKILKHDKNGVHES